MTSQQAEHRWVHALLRAEAFEHPVEALELIETHISWVILTGPFAYKIKKPVDLGFLDFSTLEKRRVCCEAEIRLNRRLAPAIYLDVVPVLGSAEAPRLTGGGDPFDYAVKMRQFPQSAQLDRMLAAGRLEPSQLDAFARLVADFHASTERAGPEDPYGLPEAVYEPVRENFEHIFAAPPPGLDLDHLRSLEAVSRSLYASLETRFELRKRLGFVREGHGDLHLANLAWVDGEPVAFDCIEFNPNLRWIDVLCDVAFLVMDLLDRDQGLLAHRFLNSYLEHTGDYEHLDVLPYYLIYRALVRAKVTAIRLTQPGLGDEERDAVRKAFEGYVALAHDCAEQARPLLILTCGLSGSGKTTVTGPLLEQLGALRIRSDVERKRLHGLTAADSGRAAVGAGIYDAASDDATYARLEKLAGALLKAGRTVIVDATFLDPARRAPFRALAREQGAACVILELTAPEETLRERVRQRSGDASDADEAILDAQLARWPTITAEERPNTITVDTTNASDAESLTTKLIMLRDG